MKPLLQTKQGEAPVADKASEMSTRDKTQIATHTLQQSKCNQLLFVSCDPSSLGDLAHLSSCAKLGVQQIESVCISALVCKQSKSTTLCATTDVWHYADLVVIALHSSR